MAATSQDQQQSIAQLVTSATSDIKTLVNDQVELTKAEVKQTAQQAGKTFGLFGAAAFVGVLFIVFLLVTIAYVLVALGLPVWAGFGIVALVLLIVTGVLGFLGKKRADAIKGPEKAVEQFKATKQALTMKPASTSTTSSS